MTRYMYVKSLDKPLGCAIFVPSHVTKVWGWPGSRSQRQPESGLVRTGTLAEAGKYRRPHRPSRRPEKTASRALRR